MGLWGSRKRSVADGAVSGQCGLIGQQEGQGGVLGQQEGKFGGKRQPRGNKR